MPYHEELDATVVIKRDGMAESVDSVGVAADDLKEANDALISDDSLDDTFFETQDVSAWLEESLFSVQRSECATDPETAQTIASKNPEYSRMSGPDEDLFNDFESDAPEPPKAHRVATKREATEVPRNRAPNVETTSDAVWLWSKTRANSRKLSLIGVSLLALFTLGSFVALNMMKLETLEKVAEPPSLSLLKNGPVAKLEQLSAQTTQPSDATACLSQGIRLGAAIERAASLTASKAAVLQNLFTVFAQRCENYQFVPRVYLQAQLNADVVPDETEHLTATTESDQPASAAMVDQPLIPGADIVEVQSVKASELIKNIQWRLVKLGFYKERADGKGRMDGFNNTETQSAISAFYKAHREFSVSENQAEIYNVIDSVYAKQQ